MRRRGFIVGLFASSAMARILYAVPPNVLTVPITANYIRITGTTTITSFGADPNRVLTISMKGPGRTLTYRASEWEHIFKHSQVTLTTDGPTITRRNFHVDV